MVLFIYFSNQYSCKRSLESRIPICIKVFPAQRCEESTTRGVNPDPPLAQTPPARLRAPRLSGTPGCHPTRSAAPFGAVALGTLSDLFPRTLTTPSPFIPSHSVRLPLYLSTCLSPPPLLRLYPTGLPPTSPPISFLFVIPSAVLSINLSSLLSSPPRLCLTRCNI